MKIRLAEKYYSRLALSILRRLNFQPLLYEYDWLVACVYSKVRDVIHFNSGKH